MPSSLPTVFIHNIAATTDPGTTADGIQGYVQGSLWFNTTNNRVWICQSNTTNAAVWSILSASTSGSFPNNVPTAFGGGTGTILESGVLTRQISATGVNPGGTAADNVIATYTIPASTFDISGRAIEIIACGTYAATANSKTVKIIFNPASATLGSTVGASGTTIASTGTVNTSGGGWSLRALVTKYGAAGSNTQLGLDLSNLQGATSPVLIAPTAITATESGAIFLAITGNAANAATDISFNYLEVTGKN